MASRDSGELVTVAGHRLRVSNLDKVLYPQTGTTKGEVLAYYAQVAHVLVPQAAQRPATRKRWVNGVGTAQDPGPVFFRKDLEDSAPDWVPRATLKHKDHDSTYPLVDNAAVLAWLGQLAALEIHVPQWRFDQDLAPARPDRMVLDLDPGPGAGLGECAAVALMCREVLEGMGLRTFPVTSGSKGIHVYAGLDGSHTSDQISAVAKELARGMAQEYPDLVVAQMKRSLREGKVFIDWSQNNASKTTVCPYSLRGKDTPWVAAPRTWDEIEEPGLRQLEFHEVLERVASGHDPIAPLGLGEPPVADKLASYRSMRDATLTPEPVPGPEAAVPRGGSASFVIQEHHARALHWDFRLEHDGVLVSWAVPKGPPLTSATNRLAVMTEDHPLDYGRFEGKIPKGQYGAGTVEIWDSGTCRIEKWEEGKEVIAVLQGKHDGGLGGVPRRYALIHAARMGGENNWLLRLMKDQPDPDEKTAASRSKQGVAAETTEETGGRVREDSPRAEDRAVVLPQAMLASAGGPGDLDPATAWAHEMKWDGYRAIIGIAEGTAVIHSRNGNDLGANYPELQEIAALAPEGAVLDGEIVVLDGSGRPDFSLLQERTARTGGKPRAVEGREGSVRPVHVMLFDALALPAATAGKTGGKSKITAGPGVIEDLCRLPYLQRRRRLEDQVAEGKYVHIPPSHDGTLEQALDSSAELGLEGVVAKDVESSYRPGKRSASWIKLKHHLHQEVVVIGWRRGNGSRSGTFGSLLLGIHRDGVLHYAGRVGTGFSDPELQRVRTELERHTRKTPAAKDVPAADRADATWVSPKLVGEVKFAGRTRDGRLRHPVWRGWRRDKEPAEVTWEQR
ncbi:ATP-dependent DNA ligase [Paeniglutamicibacter gangotriensis]|uniref:DNA ligase (ATP) n=1 Tax=Paeniglutamicibacter gangotriensis Lz1y TaxID=1276920 RepID=M7MY79_9MICC|nr:ATP-dependent DNA ligase [Paeniglutamicibacter gangotriensis]EMQ99900.1 ATP-dependent DNA ligase [Paeniglutamicibacter gangotriensis Lz1y]